MEITPEQNQQSPPSTTTPAERLAYSIQEAADLLGIHYYTMYRLIQRQKIKTCRVLRGKLLVPRVELVKLLQTDLR
jgi:excisionase family DNA binding protein